MFGFWATLRGFFDLKSELKEDRAFKIILGVQKSFKSEFDAKKGGSMKIFSD